MVRSISNSGLSSYDVPQCSLVQQSRCSLTQVLKTEMTPKKQKDIRKYQRWAKEAGMLVAFAQGGELPFIQGSFTLLEQVLGSIYLLVIVACAQVKKDLKKLSSDMYLRLSNHLKCPNESKSKFSF